MNADQEAANLQAVLDMIDGGTLDAIDYERAFIAGALSAVKAGSEG